jgi:hypothetical protein
LKQTASAHSADPRKRHNVAEVQLLRRIETSQCGMRKNRLYKITFLNLGKSYELYARHVQSSDLWGFTTISDIVFDASGESLIVDPAEEKLRDEFKNTKALHLPIQSILRIEEVDKRSTAHIRDVATGETITPFPVLPPKPR